MAAIGFKTAKCKDCYKCVRICPVKAIRIKDEHALYVADECVLCGRCLEACPQDAVVYVSDLNKATSRLRHWIRRIWAFSEIRKTAQVNCGVHYINWVLPISGRRRRGRFM